MPSLSTSRHELFAAGVARGLSATEAYVKAGYAKVGARQNAARLMANDNIRSRIKELQTRISDAVITAEIRKRSWRVEQLQSWADDMLALRAARKKLYGGQMGEGSARKVASPEEERAALAAGFSPAPVPEVQAPEVPEFPKLMVHPGYLLGGDTGMLVKDYRGKNAEQEIWKFDAALVEKFANVLKQAAIEEGQWTEKRDHSGTLGISEIMARLHAGRARAAAGKVVSISK